MDKLEQRKFRVELDGVEVAWFTKVQKLSALRFLKDCAASQTFKSAKVIDCGNDKVIVEIKR